MADPAPEAAHVKLMSLTELANELGLARTTVFKWVKTGKLTAGRFNKQLTFNEEQVKQAHALKSGEDPMLRKYGFANYDPPPQNVPAEDLITVKQAAVMLGFEKFDRQVWRHIERGKLTAYRMPDRTVRVSAAAVKKLRDGGCSNKAA